MDNLIDKLGGGWKSSLGGIALIVIGVAGLLLKVVNPDHQEALSLEAGGAMIAAGLSLLGIGHKAERTRRDVEELKQGRNGGQNGGG